MFAPGQTCGQSASSPVEGVVGSAEVTTKTGLLLVRAGSRQCCWDRCSWVYCYVVCWIWSANQSVSHWIALRPVLSTVSPA